MMRSLPFTTGYGGAEGIKARTLDFASSEATFSPCNSRAEEPLSHLPGSTNQRLERVAAVLPSASLNSSLSRPQKRGAGKDHNRIPYTGIFDNFQSKHFAGMRVRRGEHLIDAEFNRSAIR